MQTCAISVPERCPLNNGCIIIIYRSCRNTSNWDYYGRVVHISIVVDAYTLMNGQNYSSDFNHWVGGLQMTRERNLYGFVSAYIPSPHVIELQLMICMSAASLGLVRWRVPPAPQSWLQSLHSTPRKGSTSVCHAGVETNGNPQLCPLGHCHRYVGLLYVRLYIIIMCYDKSCASL